MRRPQILLDRNHSYAAIKAALAKQDSLTFWFRHIMRALVRAMRKIGRTG